MLDVLADNPVLTIFVVIAAGSAVGMIPFGPVRFGAAGALFVGLALGALDERLGEGLGLVRTIGLSLFVYTIGLAAGPTFFRTLRRQAPVMAGSVGVLLVVAAAVVVTGRAIGVGADYLAGVFAGAGTSTPALEAATDAAGGSEGPAVGYALSYPVAVVVGIVVVQVVISLRRAGARSRAGRRLDQPGAHGLRRHLRRPRRGTRRAPPHGGRSHSRGGGCRRALPRFRQLPPTGRICC